MSISEKDEQLGDKVKDLQVLANFVLCNYYFRVGLISFHLDKTLLVTKINFCLPAFTHFFKPILAQCHVSISPENVRKPLVFSRFQGVQKYDTGLKWVNHMNRFQPSVRFLYPLKTLENLQSHHCHKKRKDSLETLAELAVLRSYVQSQAIIEPILLCQASKCKQTKEQGSKYCLWTHIFTFL